MNVQVRHDPDFKPDAKRTIDIRPFFDDPKSEEEENAIEENHEETPSETAPSFGLVVSPAYREEGRRKRILEMEQEERAHSKPFKRVFLEWLRNISEVIIIFLIQRFQDFDRYINPFKTKHTEEQLAFLALSLPNSCRTADQVLLYFPLASRTQRYKMLRMRKDKLAMFERVFKKNR